MNALGLIGLGKMGLPLALNIKDHGFNVLAFDQAEAIREQAKAEGIDVVAQIEDMVGLLPPNPVIWLMVPAGDPVDAVVKKLSGLLPAGSILIDGGNSFFKHSIEHHAFLKSKGIDFLDCGTSGGISGARSGLCAMIGGELSVFQQCEHLFKAIAMPGGYLYTGNPGSGHFTKMVHNGIEYGMMQAIAEGFEVLQDSPFDFDYRAVADLWNHGSVIRGWLMELAAAAFQNDPQLDGLRGVMHSSGEGRWTVETALEQGTATPVIALSLLMRYRSQKADTFSGKVVAALRQGFGGHAVEKAD
jgi:6-phosphogluconate dehydrogenase